MFTNDSRSLSRLTKTAVVHKVIDISPEPENPKAEAPVDKLLAMMDRYSRPLYAIAGVLFAVVIVLLALPHRERQKYADTTIIPALALTPVHAQTPAQTPHRGPAGPGRMPMARERQGSPLYGRPQ